MVASKKRGTDGNARAKKEAKATKRPAKKPKTSKTPAKAANNKRVSGVKSFVNGVKIELKKVHWPTRRETMVYTGIVLSTVAAVSILIWIVDSILSKGLSTILG